MQSLTYQQNTGFHSSAMINRTQQEHGDKHDAIRDAVRSWAGADGQDVVTALIVEEYRAQGGGRDYFP